MEVNRLFTMAPALLMTAPLLIIWLAGIGLAVAFRERHPAASMLAIVALAMMFANAIAGVYISSLPMTWMDAGMGGDEIGLRLAAIGGARTFASVAAWALLLVALFKRRP